MLLALLEPLFLDCWTRGEVELGLRDGGVSEISSDVGVAGRWDCGGGVCGWCVSWSAYVDWWGSGEAMLKN